MLLALALVHAPDASPNKILFLCLQPIRDRRSVIAELIDVDAPLVHGHFNLLSANALSRLATMNTAPSFEELDASVQEQLDLKTFQVRRCNQIRTTPA